MDVGALRFAIGAWVVAVGATIGSFLNVVIARVPAGESIAWPGSRCPACRAPIAWYDNVPVISWLALRGRCRRCRAPISRRYPLVELAGAAAAWLAWSRHGLSAAAVAELAFVDLLVCLALIDLATWLLPNVLTWAVIGAGIAASAAGLTPAAGVRASATGAVLGFAAFALVSVVGRILAKKEALGFGDVWLLAGFGAWFGAPALLPVVLLASIQGSVYGLALMALGRSEPGPTPTPGPSPGADGSPSTPTTQATTEATTGTEAGTEAQGEEEEWVPPRHAVPFGPFLVAGALEWLYLAGWFTALFPAFEVFR